MIVGLVLYLYFSYQQDIANTTNDIQDQSQIDQSNQYNQLPEDNGASGSTGGIDDLGVAVSPSSSKTATVSATNTAIAKPSTSATISKSPTATATPGDLDWTRQTRSTNPQLQKSYETFAKENAGKTTCELANISDSWSKPVEKIVCGITEFFEEQIVNEIDQISCSLYGGFLAANYANNITTRYQDGLCLVEDR